MISWMPIIALYLGLMFSNHRLWLIAIVFVLLSAMVLLHFYAINVLATPLLGVSIVTFLAQSIITASTALIFSRYRYGLTQAMSQLDYAEKQSTTDSLTGLPNRRKFYRDANASVAVGQSTCLLVLDLDEFKAVNDDHGHHTGDAVLIVFAQAMVKSLPANARIYRWGGEEFAISAAMTGSDAAALAEQLRARIQGLSLPSGVSITASIGGTVIADNESIESAFQRADSALYQAKRAGRNRVVFSQQLAPT